MFFGFLQCETYSFTKETQPGSSTKGTPTTPTLPLWGQFCCRLMAQPECATAIRIQGFINVQVNNMNCFCVSIVKWITQLEQKGFLQKK